MTTHEDDDGAYTDAADYADWDSRDDEDEPEYGPMEIACEADLERVVPARGADDDEIDVDATLASIAERNAPIVDRNDAQRQADRPDGGEVYSSPHEEILAYEPSRYPHQLRWGKSLGHRARTRAERDPAPTKQSAVVSVTDGDRDYSQLGGDADAVRDYMHREAERRGWQLDDLIRPTPTGHLIEIERNRRDDLARIVAGAVERTATLTAVSTITGRPVKTIGLLRDRGRALLGLTG